MNGMMVSSSIMHPEPSEGLIHEFPDLVAEFESLSITPQLFDDNENRGKSFVIIDSNEKFLATDLESFRKKLGLTNIDAKLKVISIFGNSGDGKSHTMNNVFFNGEEVFKTSSSQNSCTMGVSINYQQFFYNHEILCIDTEGLQGVTQNENQQHRMLMKVLAISDIIIYRTRAERLSIEMYKFLATASKTYLKHFSPMLHSDSSTATAKGPDVIIFHETHNTRPLTNNLNEEPERVIKEKFAELSLSIDAFNSLHYVGIKTNHPPTDYTSLKSILRKKIETIEEEKLRPLRTFRGIYEALLMLNEKFSGDIKRTDYTFHELHFTCDMICEACNQRCENTKDHKIDDIEHKNELACIYQQQLNNKLYLCKKCHLSGNRRSIVRINDSNGDSAWIGIAKYAWSLGGTQIQKLDCPRCGEIFRAKWWYGNKSPEEICVLAEAVHIWRDGSSRNQAETHSAQAILDGFSYISDTISSVGAQPTKSLSSWVADNLVNPSYWRANSEIVSCKSCRINFERTGLKIHHCRGCGEGFCSNCSRSRMAVPKRGWGTELVRVCNPCRDELMKNENGNNEFHDNPEDEAKAVRVRKYGELVANAVSSVASALEIPKEMIKDSVRPDYWAKDSETHNCFLCKFVFGNNDELNQSDLLYRESTGSGNSTQESPVHSVVDGKIHHCRSCGHAMCNKCSLNRKPVPEHGWNTKVRVCDTCWSKKD